MPTIRTSRRLRLSLRRVVAIAGLTLSPAALTASSAAASPPSNDTLGAAFLPAAGRGTPSADNTRAPKETGEPNHAGDGGGHSIWFSWTPSFSGGAPGSARRGKWVNEPSVEVAFQEESAAPGGVATLRFFTPARGVVLQMFHAGVERIRTHGPDVMQGAGVAPRYRLGKEQVGSLARIVVGNWPSGLYFARVTRRDGRVGYAPFVVRPRRLGEHRVAVVLPTHTWQAYNFRDDDGDGQRRHLVRGWNGHAASRLGRPFLEPRRARRTSAATTCPSCAGWRETGKQVGLPLRRRPRRVASGGDARRAPTT